MTARSLLALGVFGVVVALLAPTSARAYVLKRAPSGGVAHWEDDPVHVRVRENAACGPTRAALVRALGWASDAWRGLSNAPELVVDDPRASLPSGLDGQNGVYVLCDWPYGSELAVTVLSFDESGVILDADVLVNGTQPLAILPANDPNDTRYDLASVLTHELGHVLGLDESRARAATMWPTTARGSTAQRTLATDDEDGLVAIYGEAGAAEHVRYGCSAVGGVPRAPVGTFLGVCAVAAITTAVRRGRACRGARAPSSASPRSGRS